MINLEVNGQTCRVASVAELRQELAQFASQQFREIWVGLESGGPSLAVLMNTNVGWLMYLRHDDGDPGFSSRNPIYESDPSLGDLAYDSLFNGEHVSVIAYLMSNGQKDEYPACWAVPELDVMRALEYFVEHGGCRPPSVQWHDDGQRTDAIEPLPENTQTEEQPRFAVILLAAGRKKIEVVREVRVITRLGLKEAIELIDSAPTIVRLDVAKDEAEKIKSTLETVGAKVELKGS